MMLFPIYLFSMYVFKDCNLLVGMLLLTVLCLLCLLQSLVEILGFFGIGLVLVGDVRIGLLLVGDVRMGEDCSLTTNSMLWLDFRCA